ncbi:MAG: hypothetical protein M3P30_08960 [Chloroflexota bacterium]|nr:hypothetical protein [Chloroflexota bacterium]
MYTENGRLVNLAAIESIVHSADVFTASFRLFPERLLIDTRYDSAGEGGPCGTPLVAIVDPVESIMERFFWLGQHRPSLGMPNSFEFFFWPHSTLYLEECGLWATIRDRIGHSGFGGSRETCDDALRDLVARERRATIDAIRGHRYETLWAAREI